jgi:hypothetical protein
LEAFRIPDVGCQIRNIAGTIQRRKQDTVVVSHHEVVGGDDVLAAGGRRECKRVLWIKACGPAGNAPRLNTGNRMI